MTADDMLAFFSFIFPQKPYQRNVIFKKNLLVSSFLQDINLYCLCKLINLNLSLFIPNSALFRKY